jgi:hypothetical protein
VLLLLLLAHMLMECMQLLLLLEPLQAQAACSKRSFGSSGC